MPVGRFVKLGGADHDCNSDPTALTVYALGLVVDHTNNEVAVDEPAAVAVVVVDAYEEEGFAAAAAVAAAADDQMSGDIEAAWNMQRTSFVEHSALDGRQSEDRALEVPVEADNCGSGQD